MKTEHLYIIIVIVVIVSICIIGYNYFGWFGGSNSKWNKKCIESGGHIVKSGQICDYTNCDPEKYSCSMY